MISTIEDKLALMYLNEVDELVKNIRQGDPRGSLDDIVEHFNRMAEIFAGAREDAKNNGSYFLSELDDGYEKALSHIAQVMSTAIERLSSKEMQQ